MHKYNCTYMKIHACAHYLAYLYANANDWQKLFYSPVIPAQIII